MDTKYFTSDKDDSTIVLRPNLRSQQLSALGEFVVVKNNISHRRQIIF